MIIAMGCDVSIIVGSEECHDALGLVVSDFQCEQSAGSESGCGFGDELFDEHEAVGAAIQRGERVFLDFSGEAGNIGAWDVGEVGGDDGEGFRGIGEEVGLEEIDAVAELMAGGIFAGKGKRLGPKVAGGDTGCGECECEADGYDAAAGADIQD